MRFSYWLSALLAAGSLCYGQSSAINGEITGTVTDPSGAAVAGATVQATNTGTGFKETTKTIESGLYRFPLLPLGTYDLAVQAQGFSDYRQTGIVVTVRAAATVDVALQVGATSTQVTVTSDSLITDPSRSDLGSTLSHDSVINLPLVSRNPYNFILFQPICKRSRKHRIRRAAQDQCQRVQRAHQLPTGREQ